MDVRDTLKNIRAKLRTVVAINYREETACLFRSISEDTGLPGRVPLWWSRSHADHSD
jgi:hypothetical protein